MSQARERHPYQEDEARWSALMVRAQAGEETAYRQLLTEISMVLGGYLRARFGSADFIDDCVQEVLLAVHQARHTYDPARKFRPWLFAIARHKAIDCIRHAEVRQRRETPTAQLPDVADRTQELETEVAGGQLLGALSEPFREAITLTKLQGLSVAEAASRLAISESALKVRVHRGINRLRKLLEAEAL